MLVVENWEPDLGILTFPEIRTTESIGRKSGIKKVAMFIVCDQPGLTAATFARILDIGKKYPGKDHVLPGERAKWEILYCRDRCF